MKPFESFIAPELDQYLAWRDRQGYSTESLRCQLGAFDRYLGKKAAPGQPFHPAFFLRLRTDLTLETTKDGQHDPLGCPWLLSVPGATGPL